MDATTNTTEPSPVHREVGVSAPPAAAFAIFTAQIGAWWPLTDKNVLGAGGSVGFEDGALVERSGDRRSVWADVVGWDPPGSLRLAFYPRVGPAEATDLMITFAPVGDGTSTQVKLTHEGWERLAGDNGEAARAGVDHGWGEVFDAYRRRVDGRSETDDGSSEPSREERSG